MTSPAMARAGTMIAGGHVNAHTHLYGAMAALDMPAPTPPPRSFVEILERLWWRLDRALDEDSLRASAELYLAEAVAHGTVGLFDHHESPSFIEGSLDVLADACERAGVRAVLCYGASERNGGRDEARCGLAECRRFITSNRRPLVRGVVGLHACFTISDATIREAAALARELGTVIHIHVAEDAVDVDDAIRRGYRGVLDRLVQLDALVPGSILAHGVHLTRLEVEACDAHGCWLVHNPRSNVGNGVGYARALAGSEHVALGTDGYPADMAAELRTLEAEAEAAGDDFARASRRLAAGQRLLARWFPDGVGQVTEQARARALAAIPELRARARVCAEQLWTRLPSPSSFGFVIDEVAR